MKRHLPLAVVLIMAFAGLCFAQEETPSPSPAAKPKAPRVTKAQLTKQLSDMETALWTAWKNKDAKPFQMHLTSDSVNVGDGGVSKATNITADLNACDVSSFSLSDWKMSRIGAAALLTYKATQDATCGGMKIPPAVWASTLWVKRKGAWQAAFHQETPAR
jgi:hypothetical protein